MNRDKCRAIDWQRIRLQEDFAELAAQAGTSGSAAPHASHGGLRFEALVGWFVRTWRCGDLEVLVW